MLAFLCVGVGGVLLCWLLVVPGVLLLSEAYRNAAVLLSCKVDGVDVARV